tara:strand:- start:6293 stop:6475 length:183 start_codon:yes stop_codon:yes gene_type:complete
MDKVLEDLLDLKNASFIEITPVEEITSSVMYFENNFTENPERFCPNCKCEECVKIFKIKN